MAYLNTDWDEGDGGELALWQDFVRGPDNLPNLDALDTIAPATVIQPRAGGLVLMMSEQIPHEVYPSTRDRLAIAGWWRVNASVGGRVDPSR